MANAWLNMLRRADAGETAAIQSVLNTYREKQANPPPGNYDGGFGNTGKNRYGAQINRYSKMLVEAQKRDEYNRQAAEARAQIEAANARIAQSKTMVQEQAALNRRNSTEQSEVQVVEGGAALAAAPTGASSGSDWVNKRKKQGLAKSLGVNV